MHQEHISNELVPLSSAAATVYLALGKHETQVQLADGVLDVVAIALAACIPIYAAREGDETLRRLADGELSGGKFLHGATRLHFPSGAAPQFTRLAVTEQDLARAIDRLRRAGVNFSEARFEPAPRRIPRVAPG
ncbi:MAG TPA: hypothetical protein VM183_14755 [Burkholderiales bacterium]|nr:hypothetical protein [Burkholderiales bacterium]